MLAHAGNSPTTLVETLIEALEARDSYTASHGLRVAEYAVAIAKELSAPHDDLHALQLGASLHDIGKIGIPDAILLKPGHLTENEQNLMQLHTRFGRKILRRIGGFESVLAIVELHHENFDGSGYPFGLGGEKIPLPARIVRVADAFDAMTTDRVYRPAFAFETAIEHIRSEAVANLTR